MKQQSEDRKQQQQMLSMLLQQQMQMQQQLQQQMQQQMQLFRYPPQPFPISAAGYDHLPQQVARGPQPDGSGAAGAAAGAEPNPMLGDLE
jgi:hypothetical protein